MNQPENLSLALTERFGLAIKTATEKTTEGYKIIIQPVSIERTISFHIEMLLGWRSITANFIPGNFASDLLKSIKNILPDQKIAFNVFAGSLLSKGARIDLIFDNIKAKSTAPENWPENWQSITIEMKKIGIVLEKESSYDVFAAFSWATGFFGMILALLPLEEIPVEDQICEEEGSSYFRHVKRYERSIINRAACIEIHGTSCKICSFSFGDTFGAYGEGFIHIHHIIPLSEMGDSYILNPGTDLIPVCPNCHAMLHRKRTALKPEELKLLRK